MISRIELSEAFENTAWLEASLSIRSRAISFTYSDADGISNSEDVVLGDSLHSLTAECLNLARRLGATPSECERLRYHARNLVEIASEVYVRSEA